MDVIHHPDDVSEAGFCLHLQVEPIQLGPIDRDSLCLRTTDPET
jgi:hypothetical protein